MAVSFYMDVHIPQAVTDQLRRRGVDVLTAIEDGSRELPDPDLLRRATAQGRVLVTHDIRFRVLAEDWQRSGEFFAGLAYSHLHSAIGHLVEDLHLIAEATGPKDWKNAVEHLPYLRRVEVR